MTGFPEGNAVVYCEGGYTTTNGKTAHGLVRRTRRYRVLAVIDSVCAGKDAAEILGDAPRGIPMVADIDEALGVGTEAGLPATHFVVGLAPDGGRLSPRGRSDVMKAVSAGLNVDSGLHDFLSDDPEISRLALEKGVIIRDVRKPPDRKNLHFFSGKIEEVEALKVAVLGTDSAVGKRTTAWLVVDGLSDSGLRCELIGTGQTAWMQGASHGIIMDSLINDFVSGEIEHAVWSAWKETRADALVIEGQGSLLNPAYPGGFEILAAGRPDAVVLQHSPWRREYDGFPGYPLHPLPMQIQAIELISGKPVAAVTVNHENMPAAEISQACRRISRETGLPACDPLLEGIGPVIEALEPYRKPSPKVRGTDRPS